MSIARNNDAYEFLVTSNSEVFAEFGVTHDSVVIFKQVNNASDTKHDGHSSNSYYLSSTMLTHDTVNSKYSANAGAWYYRGSAVAEMGDRHGPKSGRLLWPFPYVGGSWVPTQNNVAWAEAYLLTKWHLDPSSRLATIDMGRKVGGAVPLSGGDVGLHAPVGGT